MDPVLNVAPIDHPVIAGFHGNDAHAHLLLFSHDAFLLVLGLDSVHDALPDALEAVEDEQGHDYGPHGRGRQHRRLRYDGERRDESDKVQDVNERRQHLAVEMGTERGA